MAFDAESRRKLQVILLLGILVAAGRAAWIVYERHEAMKADNTPKQEAPMKADYYVTPMKLHPYDLKTARELTKQPEWVKLGGQLTYYAYDRARHKTEWAHEQGTLGPLEKIQVTDVLMDTSPKAPGTKQVMAVFEFDDKSHGEGKAYAVPIGAEKEGDLKIYSDDIFFIEDPRGLYNFWPADVWKAIDAHQVEKGMSELQASFAIGMGVPTGSGDYGWRTLHYANHGKPVTVTFENDRAVEIKAGA
ncbi:MAG TPA: hypothetical protein VL983_09715 [Terriglobales bacterium]|nr:hypothetical protein [Terriglobales bacterium]